MFPVDLRAKNILQYWKWKNKKLEDCANNNQYDTNTEKTPDLPKGVSRFLNLKHDIPNIFTAMVVIAYNFQLALYM